MSNDTASAEAEVLEQDPVEIVSVKVRLDGQEVDISLDNLDTIRTTMERLRPETINYPKSEVEEMMAEYHRELARRQEVEARLRQMEHDKMMQQVAKRPPQPMWTSNTSGDSITGTVSYLDQLVERSL